MNAAAILARAEEAGATVQAAGDRLRLISAAPLPPALLHDLAGVKAELLALLDRRADEAAERAAIQAEPILPPPGTTERAALDAARRNYNAGLMAAAKHRRS